MGELVRAERVVAGGARGGGGVGRCATSRAKLWKVPPCHAPPPQHTHTRAPTRPAPNVYCCGAGTAADTENVTGMVASSLELHRQGTGRPTRVVTAMTLLKGHLFK